MLCVFHKFRLREFENLQTECVAISQLYRNVNEMVVEQAPMVDKIAENVEITEIQVEEGTRHLETALKYKKTMYPIVGGNTDFSSKSIFI